MQTLRNKLRTALSDDDANEQCRCTATFGGDRLVVDAAACDGGGRLSTEAACRETVIGRLTERDATDVRVETPGVERVYDGKAVALLVAAGRFVESIRHQDPRLARRARRNALGAAAEATGRADSAGTLAADTGLAELAAQTDSHERTLATRRGLAISDWRFKMTPPADATLSDIRTLSDGDTARIYDAEETGQYVLSPLSAELTDADARLLSEAYHRLAEELVGGGDRAPRHTIRQVAGDNGDHASALSDLATILHRHTRGHGLLEPLFSDPAISDVFVTAPAPENPLRVQVGDQMLPTDIRLSEQGVEAFAARYRRESGRGFSRADPTLDAATTIDGRRIRVAGVADPVSDGVAFAFRAHDRQVWTLPALVENGTLTARAAAVLSLAVKRGAALLVAGPRGAGKTTLLGALLPELPPAVRTVLIEDAPELPVQELQRHGREVQGLRASTAEGEISPTEAVRTVLRLGDGALVLGEIRGEEAKPLYEAMRVGANSEAVLGTVHGDGAPAVYDRVVDDLGVSQASFGVTDAVITLERTADGTRQVRTIEEVVDGASMSFEPLFEREGTDLAPTGRLDRGNASLLATLSRPGETYADVREQVYEHTAAMEQRIQSGQTGLDAATPAAVEFG